MKLNSSSLSRRYEIALRLHLRKSSSSTLEAAHELGGNAVAAGLNTLELARLHERIVAGELLPNGAPVKRARLITQAGRFFSAVAIPIEKTHRTTREATGELKEFVEMLSRRTTELAASN